MKRLNKAIKKLLAIQLVALFIAQNAFLPESLAGLRSPKGQGKTNTQSHPVIHPAGDSPEPSVHINIHDPSPSAKGYGGGSFGSSPVSGSSPSGPRTGAASSTSSLSTNSSASVSSSKAPVKHEPSDQEVVEEILKMHEQTAAEETRCLAGPQENCDVQGSHLSVRSQNLDEKRAMYCHGKNDYTKVYRTALKQSCIVGLSAATMAFCAFTASRVLSSAQTQEDITKALTPAVAFGVGATIGNAIKDVFESVSSCRMTLTDGLKRVHSDLKKESESYLPKLSKDIRDKILLIDGQITELLASQKADEALALLIKREQVYLSLPTTPMDIGVPTDGGPDRLAGPIGSLIKEQPLSNHPLLTAFTTKMRDNSVGTRGFKPQLLISGRKQVGKSTFVKRLSKVTGLPLCQINIEQVELDELYKKLSECMINSGSTNPIIAFDEVSSRLGKPSAGASEDPEEKKWITAFKRLLDPDNTEFPMPGLGVNLDFSRATFILIDDQPLHPQLAQGGRLLKMQMNEMTSTVRTQAASEKLNSYLAEAIKSKEKPEIVVKIKKLIQAQIPFMVQLDERHPVARTLNGVLEDTADYIKSRLRSNDHVDEEDVRTMIRTFFDHRRDDNEPDENPPESPNGLRQRIPAKGR